MLKMKCTELRQRKKKVVTIAEDAKKTDGPETTFESATGVVDKSGESLVGSYWLTRVVFLRAIAFIYFVAFAVALNQNKELIGDSGLLPVKLFLQRIKTQISGKGERFLAAPTFLWLADPWDNVDDKLDWIAQAGMALSLAVFIYGAASSAAMLLLWLLYHSIVNVGQQWYSFGWESQLLETGFLAIWIVPFTNWEKYPSGTPTPWTAIVGYRWLIMRIMLGAGLIKVRGDQCWRDFTCMDYFYETQPNPNPYSYFAHHAPQLWHQFEVLGNHLVELVCPLLTVVPFRWAAMTNGFAQILFQILLILSGNLSFLNWLTVLPSIWFFDDAVWSRFFSSATAREIRRAGRRSKAPSEACKWQGAYRAFRVMMNLGVAAVIAMLSAPIVTNLVSSRQIMNTSFEPFRIVNTYGAFGSVTKDRSEIVFEGSRSDDPAKATDWQEYEFKCKPGSVDRRPCILSPYHYRLDWLMWFAAFQDYRSNPWLLHLAGKMLENDPVVDSLLERNPFGGKEPPKYVRISHYQYRFVTLGSPEAKKGHWWRREFWKNYLPAVSKAELKGIYKQFGWKSKTYR